MERAPGAEGIKRGPGLHGVEERGEGGGWGSDQSFQRSPEAARVRVGGKWSRGLELLWGTAEGWGRTSLGTRGSGGPRQTLPVASNCLRRGQKSSACCCPPAAPPEAPSRPARGSAPALRSPPRGPRSCPAGLLGSGGPSPPPAGRRFRCKSAR